MNSGNGYVLIHPCRLHCSPNATCRFRLDDSDEIVSYCACPNGQVVGELQNCVFGEDTNLSSNIFLKILVKPFSNRFIIKSQMLNT